MKVENAHWKTKCIWCNAVRWKWYYNFSLIHFTQREIRITDYYPNISFGFLLSFECTLTRTTEAFSVVCSFEYFDGLFIVIFCSFYFYFGLLIWLLLISVFIFSLSTSLSILCHSSLPIESINCTKLIVFRQIVSEYWILHHKLIILIEATMVLANTCGWIIIVLRFIY